MLELVPTSIDGAIVFTLNNACSKRAMDCEACRSIAVCFHNWIKLSQLEYAVFDFQDEKEICPAFLEELLILRKRMTVPFLFSGVMEQAQKSLESFNYVRHYPIFVSPEDAVRALRIQYPGLTESPPRLPIKFGMSLLDLWKNNVESYVMS